MAIVGLVSWVRFGIKLEDLQAGRRQATVMAITPQRLVIETSGPFGVEGYEMPAEQVVDVSVGRALVRDRDGRGRRLDRMQILLAGGRRIALLPGRELAEVVAEGDGQQ